MSLETQLVTMLLMVACGLIMGLLYDTYRVLKGQTGIRGWVVGICDILFWASCIFLVFGTLLRVNEGIVRIYLFLGIGVGAWLYFRLLTSIYIPMFLRLIYFSKTIYRCFIRLCDTVIIKPFICLYQTLLGILVAIVLFMWNILRFIYKIMKRVLVPIVRWPKQWSKMIVGRINKRKEGFLKQLAEITRFRNKKDDEDENDDKDD